MRARKFRNGNGASHTMVFVSAALQILASEVRKDSLPTPAAALPAIEVLRLPAHVNHAVDRACTAKHFSTPLE